MQYYVRGTDGQEYGPVGIDQMKQWVLENRIYPDTQLRDYQTNEIKPARIVPGLFPNLPPVQQIPGTYGAPAPGTYQKPYQGQDDIGPLVGVIIRSVLAIVLFFFLHGFGLVFAGYALFHSIRIAQSGSKYGVASIVIASIALVAVGVGWLLRLTGSGV